MIRPVLLAALSAAALAAAAAPAAAVAIKHTNRAEGAPETVQPSATHAAPPADTTGPHYFDRAHEVGGRG